MGEDEVDPHFHIRHAISIHSTRVGEDSLPLGVGRLSFHFNPLHPCGRRPRPPAAFPLVKKFQSTPPVWAKTKADCAEPKSIDISIHSTRVGEDKQHQGRIRKTLDFNPLHPCGRRPMTFSQVWTIAKFQSTPPVWAETK